MTPADDRSDDASSIGIPGVAALRDAVMRYLPSRLPGGKSWRADALAGASVTLANVPDGLANAILVGVNPLAGLYATLIGPLVGAPIASTQLMVITTTAAASLTAGQSLVGVPGEDRERALFMMVVIIGVLQLMAGALRLGRLTRFVSYSVSTGFLTGIAVLLILSQLPAMTGIEASASNRLVQTYDLLTRLGDVHVPSLVLGVGTIVLAVALSRTRIGAVGRLIAVVLASVAAVVAMEGVGTVADVGDIPRSVPLPEVPEIRVALDVLTGAMSVAIVILVQGAGVSQSVPNPDGTRSSASRDFLAQGAANLACGLFRGLPVGGSASATALGVTSGARTRWTAIFAGLWMAVILVGVPGLVEHVAMPALAALLVLAGVGSIRLSEIASVWSVGWEARLAGGATFVAMLALPIQAAVGLGVFLSTLLYLRDAVTDVTIVELIERDDGRLEERKPPSTLVSGEVTVLDVYGDLAYAGARTLEARLPSPRGATRPAVVLRLRGRSAAGATLIDVLAHYAAELDRADGRLYLAGLTADLHERLGHVAKLRSAGRVQVYQATPVIGESAHAAAADARAWLAGTADTDRDAT